MTAKQVLRCATLKQYRKVTYEELTFHLEDSEAFRSFARLDMGQYPSKSVLQENIKAITEDTWEATPATSWNSLSETRWRKGGPFGSTRPEWRPTSTIPPITRVSLANTPSPATNSGMGEFPAR